MDDYDYPMIHGPACGGCGAECSGMGRCCVCEDALCFFCASAREGKRYCPSHAPADATDVVTDALATQEDK